MSKPGGRRWRWKEPVPSPGDDAVPVPPPVKEEPPHDRYCDLVLTGGVASGVVYPWAIVELARAYRFRNIGGTSVGAMAAALAAAAEYGRRTGYEAPFEVLRRSPASLGERVLDGRTRMLSLFQTNAHGRRLIRLWGQIGRGNRQQPPIDKSERPRSGGLWRALGLVLVAYARPLIFGALAGVEVAKGMSLLAGMTLQTWTPLELFFAALAACLGAIVAGVLAFWSDIRLGLIENCYGLCMGGTTESADGKPGPTGLSDWLHNGIQRSAGLKDGEPPLTFRDLWNAPAHPGAQRRPCSSGDPADWRSINLQMITTNLTHGRPYRLPLSDPTSRLFFRLDELKGYFPACVLEALRAASKPYAPRVKDSEPSADEPSAQGLLELPGADLPIVVAARLSLSFPLLFSAVPLWAIDFEAPSSASRPFRRCLFTDGGVSSNFPMHLFDASVPRWPTFGMWLGERSPYWHERRGAQKKPVQGEEKKEEAQEEEEVWLPKFNGQGRGDSWTRFDPLSKVDRHHPDHRSRRQGPRPEPQPWSGSCKSHWMSLGGFLLSIATSAADWRDKTTFRLPHVRNRVARLLLLPGEGGLNIGMSREQILSMAHRYGTRAGRQFVDRFVEVNGQPSPAWSEQRWIRFNLLINGLRERLDGLAAAAGCAAYTVPLDQAIQAATEEAGPIRRKGKPENIDVPKANELMEVLRELERLEPVLRARPSAYVDEPQPELRLRPPL